MPVTTLDPKTALVVIDLQKGTSGVESIARQAFELGFNVTLAIDAMTDGDPDTHGYSFDSIFPKLAETGTSQEIIELLQDSQPRSGCASLLVGSGDE